MSSFTEPLVYKSTDYFRGGSIRLYDLNGERFAELTGGRRIFEILDGFTFDCDRTGRRFAVPHGFRCDLGSIPGVLRWALSPDDPWAQAFVLHDFLYRRKLVERKTADLVLLDALGLPFRAYTEEGKLLRVVCPIEVRNAVYLGVRLGGAGAYARQSPVDPPD